MSNVTTLGEGQLTAVDTLTIELVQTDETPPSSSSGGPSSPPCCTRTGSELLPMRPHEPSLLLS
jgi:hypothetical protein